MYRNLKATPKNLKESNRTEALDPAKMLEALFPAQQVGDPFDEVSNEVQAHNLYIFYTFEDLKWQ